MEIINQHENGLTRVRWGFYPTGDTIYLDYYYAEHRLSKRHKWVKNVIYERLNWGRWYPYTIRKMTVEEVPLPESIKRDVRDLIEVKKWDKHEKA